MKTSSPEPRPHAPLTIHWKQIPLVFFVALVTWTLHETAHWLTGTLLGYPMWITLNGVGLQSGSYEFEWHAQLVTAAGPIVTLMQALLAYVLIRQRETLIAFWFVFMAFMMRFAAMIMTFFLPNDEARLGLWLGIGPWALFAVIVTGLATLTFLAGKRLSLGWKEYVLAYLLASLVIPVIVYIGGAMPRLSF